MTGHMQPQAQDQWGKIAPGNHHNPSVCVP